MSDPVFNVPREVELTEPPRRSSFALLRRPDFRTLYAAVSVSELGDALNYIALMWVALEKGGALGVVAVRIADSVPAFVFGLHGGIAADRWSRRKLMIGADIVRAATLAPVAIAGLAGSLPLWGLVVAAFVLEGATSYFAPAYGATIPAIVDRENVQQANALVQATADGLSVGGWALAALPARVHPDLDVLRSRRGDVRDLGAPDPAAPRRPRERIAAAQSTSLREGIAALRPRRELSSAVVVFAVAMTITTGCWIAGVPTLISHALHHGAGGFSIVMIGFAVGSIAVGTLLARVPGAAEGPRQHARVADRPAGVPAARRRELDPRRLRRGGRLGRRRELVLRAAQLGRPGGDPRRGARAGARRDLVRPPRLACDRAPARFAAVRDRGRAAAVRGRSGGGRAASA